MVYKLKFIKIDLPALQIDQFVQWLRGYASLFFHTTRHITLSVSHFCRMSIGAQASTSQINNTLQQTTESVSIRYNRYGDPWKSMALQTLFRFTHTRN